MRFTIFAIIFRQNKQSAIDDRQHVTRIGLYHLNSNLIKTASCVNNVCCTLLTTTTTPNRQANCLNSAFYLSLLIKRPRILYLHAGVREKKPS